MSFSKNQTLFGVAMLHSLKSLDGFKESFIGITLQQNPTYKFLPHLRYFLKNKHKWNNTEEILRRILKKVPKAPDEAWAVWREFRSTQAEITSIFLVENYLCGKVNDIEVSRAGLKKSCDILAGFDSGITSYIEVKAQSGQQHGDKHPLSDEPILFTPQDEKNLSNWLFEEKLSASTGKPMIPYCRQASEKGADVLIAMVDIFFYKTDNILSLGKHLVSDYKNIGSKSFDRNHWKELSLKNIFNGMLQYSGIKSDRLQVFIVEAGEETSKKMEKLKEIWIFDDSRLNEMLIIRSNKTGAGGTVETTNSGSLD